MKICAYAVNELDEWGTDDKSGALRQVLVIYLRKVGAEEEHTTYKHYDRALHERLKARLKRLGFAYGRITDSEVSFYV